jgi:Zn-dependent protease
MTMPLVEGGRPIARFRVLGFPVTIDISFVVIIAILGWQPGGELRDFVVWLVIVPIAVLVHELGHAFVARTTGAHPSIHLAGLGGLTSYLPPRPLSRARSVAISVAGPAVGIVIGLALLGYGRGVGVSSELERSIVNMGIYTTLGWSILNLLPILPLDGGQTLRELLPGSPAKRATRAAIVSVVVAAGAAVVALKLGLVFGALLAAFFVFSNVVTIRNARAEDALDVNQRVVRLLWMGRPDDAQALATDPGLRPLTRSALRAVGPDPTGGRAELELAARTGAAGAAAVTEATSLLLAVFRVRGDWAAARDLVAAGPQSDAGNVLFAQTFAFRSGAKRESAEIGQAWLDRTGPVPVAQAEVPATIAYNTACGWAAAGEPDRGLAAFRRAAELGFSDLTAVDSDDDIAPLRPLAGYDEARQVIRARALAAADQGPPG